MFRELFKLTSLKDYEYFKVNTTLKIHVFIEPRTKVEYLLEATPKGDLKAIAINEDGVCEFLEKVIYPIDRQIELEKLGIKFKAQFPDTSFSIVPEFIHQDENEPNVYFEINALQGTEEEKEEHLRLVTAFIENFKNIKRLDTNEFRSSDNMKKTLNRATLLLHYTEPF